MASDRGPNNQQQSRDGRTRPQTVSDDVTHWPGPRDDVTQWAGPRDEWAGPEDQWEGPRTVIVPRREGAGFGFTLRHFVVYPPEVVIQDAEMAEGEMEAVQRSKRTKLTKQEPMDTIFVKHLKQNGPACRAGLKVGDRLVSVNGQSVRGKTYTQVISMIQASDSALKLLVVPRDEDILQVAYKSSAYESGHELSGYIHPAPGGPPPGPHPAPGPPTTTTSVPGGRLPGYSNLSNGEHASPVYRSELRFHSLDKTFDDSPESSGREDNSIRDSSEPPGSVNSSRRGSVDMTSRGESRGETRGESRGSDDQPRVSVHSLSVLPARARQANVDIHQLNSPPPPSRHGDVRRQSDDVRRDDVTRRPSIDDDTASRSSSDSSNRWSAPIHESASVRAYKASLLRSQEDLYGRKPSLSKSNTTGQLRVDKRVPLSILPQPYTSIMAQNQRSVLGKSNSRSTSTSSIRYLPAYGSNPSMCQPSGPRVTIHRRKSLDDILDGQRGETRVGIEAKGSGHVMKIEKVGSSSSTTYTSTSTVNAGGTSVSVTTSPNVSVTVKRVDSPSNLVAERTKLFESGLQQDSPSHSRIRNQLELRKLSQPSPPTKVHVLNQSMKQTQSQPESPARSQISVQIRNQKEAMRQQFFASANMFASPEIDLSVSSPDIREQDRPWSPTLDSGAATASISKCELTKKTSIGPVRQAALRSTDEFQEGKLAAAARAVRARSYLTAVQAPVDRYGPRPTTHEFASESDAHSASTYAAMVKSASYSLTNRRDSDVTERTSDVTGRTTPSQSSYSSVDSPSYKDNDVFLTSAVTSSVTSTATYSTSLVTSGAVTSSSNHGNHGNHGKVVSSLEQSHPGVTFRKKSEEDDSEVKLFRRISYLKATARDRGHLSLRLEPVQDPAERLEERDEEEDMDEDITDMPTTPTKGQSIRKLKSFFGERVSKTPRILEATRPVFTDPVSDVTSEVTSDVTSSADVTQEQLTEGVLLCKMTQLDGKRYADRSWRSYWCSLAEGHPYMYRERRDNVPSSSSYSSSLDEQPISVQDCRVDVAADYLKKRKHVLRLSTSGGAEYLLQTEDHEGLVQWYEALQSFTASEEEEEKPGAKRPCPDAKTSPQIAPKSMKKLVSFRARSPHSPGPKGKESPGRTKEKEKYWKRLEERKEVKTWRGKVVKTMRRFGSQAETAHHVIEETEDISDDHTFGVPLEACPPSSYSETVPLVVELCTSIIEHRGLDYTGIYRVPGNSVAIQTLQDELNRGTVNLDNDKWLDVNVVSSLLKLFFRQLPVPLITADLYGSFIAANRVERPDRRMLSLKRLIHELPEHHFDTLKFMGQHLYKVASNGGKNKMDSKNLAIVFGPTLIRGRNDDKMTMVIDMSDQCRIIETIINNNEWFFSSWDVDNEVPVDSNLEETPSTLAGTETKVSGSVDEDEREALASRHLMASIISAAQRKLRERDVPTPGITSTSRLVPETVHEERNIDEEVAKRQQAVAVSTRETLQAARLAFLTQHEPSASSQDSLDLLDHSRFSKLSSERRRLSSDLSPEPVTQRASFHADIPAAEITADRAEYRRASAELAAERAEYRAERAEDSYPRRASVDYHRQTSRDREQIDSELARTRQEMMQDEACLSDFIGRTQTLSQHIEDVTQRMTSAQARMTSSRMSGPHPAPRVSVYAPARSRSYGNLLVDQPLQPFLAPLDKSPLHVRRSLDSLCNHVADHATDHVAERVPDHAQLQQSFSSSDDGTSDLLTSLTTTFDQKLRILLDPKTKFSAAARADSAGKGSAAASERKDENWNQVPRYGRPPPPLAPTSRDLPPSRIGIASRFQRDTSHDTSAASRPLPELHNQIPTVTRNSVPDNSAAVRAGAELDVTSDAAVRRGTEPDVTASAPVRRESAPGVQKLLGTVGPYNRAAADKPRSRDRSRDQRRHTLSSVSEIEQVLSSLRCGETWQPGDKHGVTSSTSDLTLHSQLV